MAWLQSHLGLQRSNQALNTCPTGEEITPLFPYLVCDPWRSVLGKTVLIVEDNDLNMKLFNDLLISDGYKTLQSRNGLEAFAMTRTYRPDLILMDIQLPVISGLEVVSWIKQDTELMSIPVIAVTAFAMQGNREMILERGCEMYISKPISVEHFLNSIRSYF